MSFETGPGITGLLGPNGAGKTTLLRILATVLPPDEGEVRILGLDPMQSADRSQIRRQLGYMPQDDTVYPHFRTREFVEYFAILKDLVDRRSRHREVQAALEMAGLNDVASTRIKALSGGMRRRVMLAQALLNDPAILLLDEPTSGLDPEQRMRFRQMLSRLGEQRTALLSTHNTEDVAALCRRVIVVSKGKALFDGPPSGLAALARGRVWASADLPTGALVGWRTGEGTYRVLGDPPSGARVVEPTIEDGYLMLVGVDGASAA